MKTLLIFAIANLVMANIASNDEENVIIPGSYLQWNEKLPLSKSNDPDYVPNCKKICNQKCGGVHKGVSICGSMFEYADNPEKDPVGFDKTISLTLKLALLWSWMKVLLL